MEITVLWITVSLVAGLGRVGGGAAEEAPGPRGQTGRTGGPNGSLRQERRRAVQAATRGGSVY